MAQGKPERLSKGQEATDFLLSLHFFDRSTTSRPSPGEQEKHQGAKTEYVCCWFGAIVLEKRLGSTVKTSPTDSFGNQHRWSNRWVLLPAMHGHLAVRINDNLVRFQAQVRD